MQGTHWQAAGSKHQQACRGAVGPINTLHLLPAASSLSEVQWGCSARCTSTAALVLCLAGWRAVAQELAARKLGRCFYCWRWYCQVRLLREVAFQNKRRAIKEALAVGEQVARRRKAVLLAASFMAWHIQVSSATAATPLDSASVAS